jgi:histidinol-phosphate aminotransferase
MLQMFPGRFNFNRGTRKALLSCTPGYLSRDCNPHDHVESVKKRYSLEKAYRFDLGQNNDGCAPEVADRLGELLRATDSRLFLKEYPAFSCRALVGKLADLHGVPPGWILISAGIEQMIGMIAGAFIEPGDRVGVNDPSFFVFESFSHRAGADVERLFLRECNDYNWTMETVDAYRRMLHERGLKLVWIANPNNPTGLCIPEAFVEYIVREASRHGSVVVFDEAYGEYNDPVRRVNSASRLLHAFDNLVVLRTFSKAYGLAGLRIGYAISSNRKILRALKLHSYNYPITQFSLELADCALENMEYLEETRQHTRERGSAFLKRLGEIRGFSHVGTDCSILMIRHENLSAGKLTDHLERGGIFTSKIPASEAGDRYVRVTLGSEQHNRVFLNHLEDLQNAGLLDARYEASSGADRLVADGWK